MMRKALLLALVAVMPLGSVRVVCLAPAPDVRSETSQEHESSDCERLCALHRPEASSSDSDCALTAAASSIVVAGIAVVPVEEPLRVLTVVSPGFSAPDQLYPEPGLAHTHPPPKTLTLNA